MEHDFYTVRCNQAGFYRPRKNNLTAIGTAEKRIVAYVEDSLVHRVMSALNRDTEDTDLRQETLYRFASAAMDISEFNSIDDVVGIFEDILIEMDTPSYDERLIFGTDREDT